jgi:hypothetical protein
VRSVVKRLPDLLLAAGGIILAQNLAPRSNAARLAPAPGMISRLMQILREESNPSPAVQDVHTS